jgi:hypothetical protein
MAVSGIPCHGNDFRVFHVEVFIDRHDDRKYTLSLVAA